MDNFDTITFLLKQYLILNLVVMNKFKDSLCVDIFLRCAHFAMQIWYFFNWSDVTNCKSGRSGILIFAILKMDRMLWSTEI